MKHHSLLVLCVTALLSTAPWSASPADGGRVVAVGDIHGDLDAFLSILKTSALIDSNLRWAGGKATLVQTGDFTDRGPKVRPLMDFLMALEKDAQRMGGRVHVLLGNHEAMNVYGDLRYVTATDYSSFSDAASEQRREAAFSGHVALEKARGRIPDRRPWMEAHPAGFVEHREAFGPAGKYGRWVRSLPAVLKVGDTVFVHGGISPELPVARLNRIREAISVELKLFDATRQYMVDQKLALPFYTLEELAAAAKNEVDSIKTAKAARQGEGREGSAAEKERLARLEGFLSFGGWLSIHPEGPLWYRGYDRWSDEEGQGLAVRLLETLQAARIVVGHTPQQREIRSRFGGRVFLIDTGMLSSYYQGGRASALDIVNGKVAAIYASQQN